MKTMVLGLAPYLDKERYRTAGLPVFADDYAFIREGVLRCFSPNLAAIAVTTNLHELGFPVEYLDLVLEFGLPLTDRTREAWLKRIEGYFAQSRPDAVFIPCVSAAEHVTLKQLAASIRRVCPDCVIGTGSYHANALRESLLRQIPELDFIFLGDIESSTRELMSRLEAGKSGHLAEMKNVITRHDLNGADCGKRPPAHPSASRFSYRVCDRYLRFYDSMPVVGMKGCPFSCAFCQEKTVRPGFHQRDPSDVIAEAVDNYAVYESKIGHRRVGYSFMEPVFGFDRKWTEQFLTEIESAGLHFYWGAQTRVGRLDEGQLRHMAQCGCRIIFYGLENFSPQMLRLMNKTNNPEQYLQSFQGDLRNCLANGIAVEANILFGFAGETESSLKENEAGIVDMLSRFPHTGVNLNLFRPLPGTRGLNDMKLDGGARLLVQDWWSAG